MSVGLDNLGLTRRPCLSSFGAMTAAKLLADEYEKMNKPDLAADLRKDAKVLCLPIYLQRLHRLTVVFCAVSAARPCATL